MLAAILPILLLAPLSFAHDIHPPHGHHHFVRSTSVSVPFLHTPAELRLLRQSLALEESASPAPPSPNSKFRLTSAQKATNNPFAKYTSVVVFGDSYSDDAHPRASQFASKLPGAPYWRKHYSNGPVWNEYLAEAVTKTGTLYNYAYGGAQINNKETGNSKAVPATLDQVKTHIADLRAGRIDTSGRTLYVMAAGINPITALWVKLIADPPSVSTLPKSSRDASKQQAQEAVEQLLSVDAARRGISNAGDWDMLIMTIPSLDEAPGRQYMTTEKGSGKAKQLSLLKEMCERFNNDIIGGVQTLKEGTRFGTGVYLWDLGRRWTQYTTSPGSFGLDKSVVMVPCAKSGKVCTDPERRLYFDSLHPVTTIHEKIAKDIQSTVGA